MKIPSNYTEQEVINIINTIASKLAGKFKFGYHELDDMKQQAALFAWQGLEKYDEDRPLENFLWVHVRNRLFNFKRNNYARPDKPCNNCPLQAYVNLRCTAFKDQMECEIYEKWHDRNQVKKDLSSTKIYSESVEKDIVDLEETIFSKTIYHIIDTSIGANFRQDWIRFCNKAKLSKNRREMLMLEIVNILKENNIDV